MRQFNPPLGVDIQNLMLIFDYVKGKDALATFRVEMDIQLQNEEAECLKVMLEQERNDANVGQIVNMLRLKLPVAADQPDRFSERRVKSAHHFLAAAFGLEIGIEGQDPPRDDLPRDPECAPE